MCHFQNGESVLHIAGRTDNTEITRLLLASGANIAAADSMGETAVFHTARHGNMEQLALLIRAGASLTSCNKVRVQPPSSNFRLKCLKLLSRWILISFTERESIILTSQYVDNENTNLI